MASDDWMTRREREEEMEEINRHNREQEIRDYDAAMFRWQHGGRQGPMPRRPDHHPDNADWGN